MKIKNCILVVAAVIALALAPSASATMQLTLQSGSSSITLTDASTPGSVSFNGAVGNWNTNLTGGFVGTNPLLDLISFNQNRSGASPLTITLVATGFSSPFNANFFGNIGGTLGIGHSLAYSAFVNSSQIGSTLTFSNPSSASTSLAFSGTVTGGSAPANTVYSLTNTVTITSSTAGNASSFDAGIDAVPEPATMTLLGGVLLATFGVLKRRRQNTQNT